MGDTRDENLSIWPDFLDRQELHTVNVGLSISTIAVDVLRFRFFILGCVFFSD